MFPDFGNFVYYQVKVGIFFWVKTLINGLLCFMLLWSHWFSASLLLKDSPLIELCCWKIWKTYFESLYRKKLVLKVSILDNFLNFCCKKFLIWCFNIDLSNFCAIQCHKRRIFKALPMTGLAILHILFLFLVQGAPHRISGTCRLARLTFFTGIVLPDLENMTKSFFQNCTYTYS